MAGLKDFLPQPSVVEPKPNMPFTPTSEYDGTSGYIQTAGLTEQPNYTELLEFFGYDPKEVRIIGTLKTSRWQQREDGEWLSSYKFAIGPVGTSNIQELIDLVNKRKPVSTVKTTNDKVFHWLAGDLQLGKIDGDGTEGIVNRVLASIESGVSELKRLRKTRSIGLAHIAWLGDCIEGNVSQNGRTLWRTELTITEQYRLFRRLALYAIDSFAPYAERLEVDVVNGNHDEAQRMPVSTRKDDGHATEAMIAVADAMLLNPAAYGHVATFVPNVDESFITRQIGGAIFTHAHGNQWRKGKAFEWWSGQALNFQSAGASQFLLHGHEHEAHMNLKRDRTVLCVPTFESESNYWRQAHGDVARTGAVVMVTGDGPAFQDFSIV